MTHSRQRKSSLALRLCAVGSLLVWIAASGFCSVESLIGADHHADGAAQHEHGIAASADSDHHSPDSDKKDGDEHSCCSSLAAATPPASQTVLTKPDFGKSLQLDFLWLAQTLTFVHSAAPISRQPPDRQWVFTPEVYLGPAFRSHAPPLV